MSGIFGIFFRDVNPVPQLMLETMDHAMSDWGRDCSIICDDCCIGFGQRLTAHTPEEHRKCPPIMDAARSVAFTCAARLDNRREIGNALAIPVADSSKLSDSDIIRQAYYQWGEYCTDRLYGDWAFAAWHPNERRLFLARDHFGITSLYYYADRHVFAFASSRQALLALKLAPVELDELYLAQVLTSWPAYNGERTIQAPIRRLPPAHRLTVTPDRLDIRQYWYLEKTPELYLPRREDYVTAFREVFDDAVQARLHAPMGSDGKAGIVASTLSGGLDSSAVTATAAGFLSAEGRRITAYTSVPIFDTTPYVRERFGDEFPLAAAMARFAGNVDIYPVTAADCTPIQAIRRMLQIHNEPVHAAGNFFWLLELWKAAQTHDSSVLLVGQFGNAGVSWTGDFFSQSLVFQLRRMGWRQWAKERIKRKLLPQLLAMWRRYRTNQDEMYRLSAINPAFADRLHLMERRLNDPDEQQPRRAIDLRRFLLPGRNNGGAQLAQTGAAFGFQVRDPTADARVLAFTFSVPDHIFLDPQTGMDRWLIREAMKGRLPDEVRLNRSRGRQAGDRVPRLRASAAEVENTLNELAQGPAATYLDVPYMRQVWQMIRTQDTPEAFTKSGTVLLRGIMAGLFVNNFYK